MIIINEKDEYEQTFSGNTTTFTKTIVIRNSEDCEKTIIETIVIKNIDDYEQTFSGNTTTFTKKTIIRLLEEERSKEERNTLSKNTIKNIDLRGSKIMECKINNISVVDKCKYISILVHLYLIINDKQFIINNTKMHVKPEKQNFSGFTYYENIDLSIQNKDAKNTLLEIINMILHTNHTIVLKIQINNGEIIIIRINNGEIILN
jgi:hypothetical protein